MIAASNFPPKHVSAIYCLLFNRCPHSFLQCIQNHSKCIHFHHVGEKNDDPVGDLPVPVTSPCLQEAANTCRTEYTTAHQENPLTLRIPLSLFQSLQN